MVPKRSRTSTSYDTIKFVSIAASNRYETSLLEKVPTIYQLGHSIALTMSLVGEDGESSVNNHLLPSSLWCESSMLMLMSTKGV